MATKKTPARKTPAKETKVKDIYTACYAYDMAEHSSIEAAISDIDDGYAYDKEIYVWKLVKKGKMKSTVSFVESK